MTEAYRRCTSRDPVQKAIYADLKVYMSNDPLVKVDRMSMQHGLEIRCPLLDHRLVELAFRVPVEIKMPSLRSKHLRRELAAQRLPRGLSKLLKRGFTAPIGEWIAGPYRGRFEDEVLTAGAAVADILDVRRLPQLFTDHCAGRADHWYSLWAAWVYKCWSNLDRSERASSPVETAAHLA